MKSNMEVEHKFYQKENVTVESVTEKLGAIFGGSLPDGVNPKI